MSQKTIRIASRKSPLAMRQTELVKSQLLALDNNLKIEIIQFQTQGDKFLSQSLSKIGGKGLFVKELEHALLNNEADVAVHSMKDLPYSLPSGLQLSSILEREDVSDALISPKNLSFNQLPQNAKVGTSSLRRACQLKALRPDIEILPLRGNINTRFSKIDNFDAIVLAKAGLRRMQFDNQITETFLSSQIIPAAGQGALGIESRSDDIQLNEFISKLNCRTTRSCVLAERGVIAFLEGSCSVPLAAHAYIAEDSIILNAMVGTHDGKTLIKANGSAPIHSDPKVLGEMVAKSLLEKGAGKILEEYKHD